MGCYVAVSIARNEESLIEKTILSVLNQTIPPEIYVIVDDGSTDKTPEIIKKYSDRGVQYVKVKGERQEVRSYNLCRAVNLGYKVATSISPDWCFGLKVDCDSVIPPDYAENMLAYMEQDQGAGIVSGCIENRKMWKGRPSDGAKLYRRSCWDAIGGMDYVIGWDTHGIIKCNMMGFRAVNTMEPYSELRTSKRESWKEWYFTGATRYFLGLPLWHTAGVSVLYFNDKPYFIGSLIMVLTHLLFRLRGVGRVFDEDYYRYATKFALWETLDRLRDKFTR